MFFRKMHKDNAIKEMKAVSFLSITYTIKPISELISFFCHILYVCEDIDA